MFIVFCMSNKKFLKAAFCFLALYSLELRSWCDFTNIVPACNGASGQIVYTLVPESGTTFTVTLYKQTSSGGQQVDQAVNVTKGQVVSFPVTAGVVLTAGAQYYLTAVQVGVATNKCTSATVTMPGWPPTITVTPTNPTSCNPCNGQIAVSTNIGSNTSVTYTIKGQNSGVTASSTVIGSTTFTGLRPDSYTVTVNAGSACSYTVATPTTLKGALTVQAVCSAVSCNGGGDGSMSVTVSGGTAPYTYTLDSGNPTPSSSTTFVFGDLASGSHQVQVVDANNCIGLTSCNVAEPNAIVVSTTVKNVSCFGGNDGSITASAAGCNGNYQFSLDNTNFYSSGVFNNLSAGTYDVYCKDSKSCLGKNSCSISQPNSSVSFTISQVNVLCNGAATGSITVTASGGTAPYSYSSNGGTSYQSSNVFSELEAQAYTIIVKDANNCVGTSQQVTITQPEPMSFTTSQVNVLCNGAATGSITVTASGGTAPYSYSNNGGTSYQSSNVFNGLKAQAYTLVVKDANNCVSNGQQVTISQPNSPVSFTTSQVNVLCNGAATGSITVAASGGTAPYSYSNNGGTSYQSSNVFNGLKAQAYTLVVKDANNCVGTSQQVTIGQPNSPVSFTTSQVNVLCNGAATGSITVTASGGTAPYSYSSNGGTSYQSSNVFSELEAQAYTIIVKDANNCVSNGQQVTISQPNSPVSFTTSQVNVLCNGAATGSITVTASGGTSSYSYSSNGGTSYQSSNVFSGLKAQAYTIIVKDANNCVSNGQQVTISQPNSPVSFTTSQVNVLCNGAATGSITVTASGGTAPYSYSSNGGTSYQSSNVFSELEAQAYTIIVKDANNCVSNGQQVTISQPNSPVSFTTSQVNVLCNGAATGSITVTASGGTAPYSYSNNGGTSYQSSNVFNGLKAQAYTIIVKDANNCVSNGQQVTISQPNSPVSFTTSQVNVLCNGAATGSITVTASGGTAPYSYSSNGGTSYQSSNVFNGLKAQAYTIIVKDANNCLGTSQQVTISQPNSPVSFTTSQVNVLCNGAATGSITVTASGGTAPYSYSADGGSKYQSSNVFSALAAGSYVVVVKDANNCVSSGQQVIISQPDSPVSFTKSQVNVLCNGAATGSITVTASGGTAPYSYSANGGSTYQSSNVFNELAAGSYVVVVKDSNNCISAGQQVIISQPDSGVSFTTSQVNVLCNGAATGSITVTASGGTESYSYSANGGSTYQNSNMFSGLIAGNYTVVVKDANNCISNGQQVTISQPDSSVSFTTSQVNVLCNGAATGSITVTASGGTAPYGYSNDGGNTYQNSNMFSGLTAGSYTIIVKDVNNCVSNGQQVIISQPDSGVSFTTSQVNVLCNGAATGSITVTANGGTAPYSYSADGGSTYQSSNVFNELAAGSYVVVVKDANNCVSSGQQVIISQPDSVASFTTSQVNVLCNGAATGSITVTASGGTAPYGYSNDGGNTYQNSNVFSGLIAGNYTVVVKDANNCISNGQQVTISQPDSSASFTTSQVNVLCNGAATGSITVTASGGTSPYSYSNNGGTSYQSSNVFSGLTAGSYTIIVKDSNNCVSNGQQVIISQPDSSVSFTTSQVNVLCNGAATGSITVTASGGTAPYGYSNDGGNTYQNSNMFSGLTAGSYTIIVKDSNNCVSNGQQVIISQPDSSASFTTSQVNVLCNGAATGSITVTASGGTAPHSYSNDGGNTYQDSNVFNGLAAGSYVVVVKDANNCVSSGQQVIISQPDSGVSFTTSQVNVLCNGAATGSITVTASGGTSPYSYSNNGGTSYQSSNVFSGLTAGSYTIIVKDSNNCISNGQQVIISQPDSGVSFTTSQVNVLCNGAATGSITVTASGGTSPYSYSNNGGTSYQSSNVFNGLKAQAYTLVVKDANNCVGTSQQVTIGQPNSPVSFTTSQVNVLCNGAATGSITVTASGGTAPYSYSSNGGTSYQSSNVFSELEAQAYTIIVKDANNCVSNGQQVTISQPNSPVSFTTSQVNVLCNGAATGSITVTASGGTSSYSYSSNGGTSYQSSNVFSGLKAQAYTIIVKDANNCVSNGQQVTISQPNSPVSFTTSQVNVLCNGAATGSITVTASGGTAPYSYSSNGGTSYQSSNVFRELEAQAYTIIVKDANNCVSNGQQVTISQPDSGVSFTTSQVNVLCNGAATGSITVTASGGTAQYIYSADGGNTYQNSNVFSGLAAGSYVVVVKDANNCVSSGQQVIISQPDSGVSITTSQVNVLCNGAATGSITVTASGGTAQYIYSADGGNTYQNSNVFSGLAAGSYVVVVKDANNCVSSGQQVIISQPDSGVSITTSQVNVLCNGAATGSITVTASGGTAPYSYSSNGGSTYQSSNVFNELAAGSYVVVVKDSNNCISAGQQVIISQPDSGVSFTTSQVNVLCNGAATGSITVTASGGTAPYSYSADGGSTYQNSNVFSGLAAGSYVVVVKDSNNCISAGQQVIISQPDSGVSFTTSQVNVLCNGAATGSITVTASGGTAQYIYSADGGNTYQNSNVFSGLTAGSYTIIVKDSNNCISNGQQVIISQPDSGVSFTTSQVNVLCNGAATGSITVTASGGTAPYSYSANGGSTYQSSNVFNELAAGSYVVVVKDSNNCISAGQQVIISQPDSGVSFTTSQVNVLCNGAGTGSITVTASGGTAPYSYSADGGSTYQNSNVFSGLTAGSYTIIVKDSNNCVSSGQQVIISQPDSGVSFTTSQVNVLCNGAGTGSITVTASGGTAPYSYSADGGSTYQNSNVFSGLTAGSYTIIVKDSNNCISNGQQVTISQPNSPVSFTTSQVNVLCNDAATGSITVTASGGTAPYSYSADGGNTYQNSNVFSGLVAGSYVVVVQDSNDCVSNGQQVTISQPDSAVSFTTSQVNVLCNGAATGSITVTASGGTAPYSYSANGGSTYQSSNVFNELAAGSYVVVVKDSNNCVSSGQQVIISQPDSGVSFTTSQVNVLCNGAATGSIAVTASGGTAPYSYSANGGSTYQSSNVFNELAAGSYVVVVKDSNNCISAGQQVIISQPDSGVSFTTSQVNVLCNGAATGSITVTASGGTAPYGYSADGGSTYQSSNVFNGLVAGSYVVVVKDANNCVSSGQQVAISQPDSLVSFTTSQVNVLCNGAGTGSITVTASGGTAPYSYSADGGNTYQNSNVFSGLAAGSYVVVVKDANNCVSSGQQVIISQPDSGVSITTSQVNVLCNGAATGSITVTASGGTAPYSYSANGGSTYQSSNVFNELVAGSYAVVVTDANNCVSNEQQVIISQPDSPASFTTSQVNVLCNGAATGSITVTASGGTAPYSYSANGGSTYQSSNVFNGLVAGSYVVVVKDSNNCVSNGQQVTISQPDSAVSFTTSQVNVLCNGAATGSIRVTASGGTAPYSYSANGGSTYQSSNVFNELAAGSYVVVVKDANNCVSNEHQVIISQPDSPASFMTSQVNVLCNGAATGSITVTASGGTSPYSYSANGGNTYQSSNVFNGLVAGSYVVVVNDANNCVSNGQQVIISQPDSPASFTTSQVNVLCNGAATGSITVTASGGTSPYSYSNNGGTSFQSSNVFSGLTAGSYTIIVKDSNNCISNGQQVIISQPDSVASFTTSQVNVLCNGAATGSITVTASGGTAPYSYSADGGNTYQNSNVFSGLVAGSYVVVVQDSNDCVSNGQQVTISQPDSAVSFTTSQVNVLCNGAATGSITVTASGGTAPYSYSANGGSTYQSSNVFNELVAGSYVVVVKDANNCISNGQQVIISQPDSPVSFTTSQVNVLCNGAATGSITVTASGGTSPYSYSANGGNTYQSSNVFNGLVAGSYVVVVKDANNCVSNEQQVIISQPDSPASFTTSQVNVLCNGAATGSITVTASGGTSPYSYSNNGGTSSQSSNVFSGLTAGSYTIIVKDSNNCISNGQQVTISQPNSPVSFTTSQVNVLCNDAATGSITVTASGGTAPYSYSADGGNTYQNSNVFSGLVAGSYVVVVQDSNDCVSNGQQVTISQPDSAVSFTTSQVNVLCNGAATGSITVTASGGTAPYSYSNDGGNAYQNSNVFNELAAGSYDVVVKDANNCVSNGQQVIISQPGSSVSFTTSQVSVLCNGAATGSITVTASGGTAPYGLFE